MSHIVPVVQALILVWSPQSKLCPSQGIELIDGFQFNTSAPQEKMKTADGVR